MSQDGYAFIGYHGTNAENMRLMVPYRISTGKMGSEAGLCAGVGFYVSFSTNIALNFAGQAAQDSNQPYSFLQNRYPARGGGRPANLSSSASTPGDSSTSNSRSITSGGRWGWGLWCPRENGRF